MTTSAEQDPVQRARMVYEREECSRNFEEDFCLHWNNPYAIVHKDDANLAFARPVSINDPYERITDPSYISHRVNAWWVYLLVGDFHFLLSLLPYDLEYIGWERNNKPRFYKLKQLRRWISTDPTSIQRLLDQTDD
jgi:hypothetical protein